MSKGSKTRYCRVFSGDDQLPFFFEPWWLDLVCGPENWDAAVATNAGDKITGIFPYYRQRLKGLPVLSNPPLTPYLGIRLFYPENQTSITSRYSFENKTGRELIAQLPTDVFYMSFGFIPEYENGYPFHFAGFRQSIRYTYILDNIRNTESIHSNFSQTLRRQLKKTGETIECRTSESSATLFKLFRRSLQRQGTKVPVGPEKLEALYQALRSRNQGEIIQASAEDGEILAAMLLAWDSQSAYCLVLGMNDEAGQHDAVKELLWYSIRQAANRVNRYNFEGSMIGNVERVFRSFGGTRTGYYHFSWYRNRWIRTAMAFLNK